MGLVLWVFFRTQLTVSPEKALANGRHLLRGRTVLAVAAHPDDLEWYVGGTLRRLSDEGARVHVIVASFGEKGPNLTHAGNLAETRELEQLRAARINGYAQVHFFGLPDKGVVDGPAMRQKLTQVWQSLNPDIVLTFDPVLWSLPYLHPDHQGSGRTVYEYWRSMRRESRPSLFFWQSRRPNAVVDISDTLTTKERALNQHFTQNLGRAGARNAAISSQVGHQVGIGYGESFRRLQ